ncbi:MAG TPA: hypothetical protein PLP25_01790 [Candidatus Limiplasma sp.]|nr:hypothetical protein [Candidatus Limiplasma sp.]HPS80578.1 hypothetical protein [Candidatus Limiplasma sp.]
MKFWRIFGGLLTFIGCVAALAGILATAAPMVDNDQMRRIIESFSLRSTDPLLNTVNAAILWCLHNNYMLFGLGAAILLFGGLLKTAASRSQNLTATVSESAKPSGKTPQSRTATQPRQPVAADNPPYPKKQSPGISPYAAAQYGKALAAGSAGGDTSEIARKYLPKSIIATDDVSEEPITRATASAAAEPSVLTAQKTDGVASVPGALAGVILCPACGKENPVNLVYCTRCGEKLPARLSLLAQEAKQAAFRATGLGQENEDHHAQPSGGLGAQVVWDPAPASVVSERPTTFKPAEPYGIRADEPTGMDTDIDTLLEGSEWASVNHAGTVTERAYAQATPYGQAELTAQLATDAERLFAGQTGGWQSTAREAGAPDHLTYEASTPKAAAQVQPSQPASERGAVRFHRPAMDAMAAGETWTQAAQKPAPEGLQSAPPASQPTPVKPQTVQTQPIGNATDAARQTAGAEPSRSGFAQPAIPVDSRNRPRIVSTFPRAAAGPDQTGTVPTGPAGAPVLNSEPAEATAPKAHTGPRIVSTMGRKMQP